MNKNSEHKLQEQEVKIDKIKNKTVKDSALDYVADVLLNRLTGGDLSEQTSNFQIAFNKILSEKHKKVVFHILEFPTEVRIGHLERFRKLIKDALPFDMREKFDLQILQYDMPNKISLTDKKMTRYRRSVSRMVKEQEERLRETAKYMKTDRQDINVTDIDVYIAEQRKKRLQRKESSFLVAQTHTQKGGAYVNSYIFLELVAQTQEILNVAKDLLTRLLQSGNGNNEPYVFEIIDVNLYEYIKQFGLVAMAPVVGKKEILPCMPVTSNVAVASEEFKPGIVRAPSPKVYGGHILSSQYPFHTSFVETTDASNILILADTGSGKTVLSESFVLWLLLDKKQHVIVNDYKGNEWLPLARKIKNAKILDFSLTDPHFINTYIIPDYKILGFKKPQTAYTMCEHITTDILISLVNPPPQKMGIVQAICSSIVNLVYSNYKIDILEPYMYEESRHINFLEDTWSAINEISMYRSGDIKADDKGNTLGISVFTAEDVNMVRSALAVYFDRRGPRRSLFENQISLEEYLDTRFLVINRGTQMVAGDIMSDSEKRCFDLQKNYLTSVYCGIQKSKHENSTEIQEEVAQQFGDALTCKYLCRDITGCRSNNKTNILITNSLEPLINPKVNDEFIRPIRRNINTFVIGRCQIEEAESFIKYASRPDLREDILKVASQLDPSYSHAFMFIQKEMGFSVITKMIIPDNVLNEVMRSRDADHSERLYMYGGE